MDVRESMKIRFKVIESSVAEYGARWWPCMISTYVEPGSLQMWVICEALLSVWCKTPLETHASRILVEPLIAELERIFLGDRTVTITAVQQF